MKRIFEVRDAEEGGYFDHALRYTSACRWWRLLPSRPPDYCFEDRTHVRDIVVELRLPSIPCRCILEIKIVRIARAVC
jgi:hypothetical protein